MWQQYLTFLILILFRMLDKDPIHLAIKLSCAVHSKRMASANTATSVNLLTVPLNFALLIVTPSTKPNCVEHSIQ